MDNLHAAILLVQDRLVRRGDCAAGETIAAAMTKDSADIAALDLPDPPGAGSQSLRHLPELRRRLRDPRRFRTHLEDAASARSSLGRSGAAPFHRLGLVRIAAADRPFLDRTLLLPMNHLLRDDQVLAVISAVQSFF